MKDSSLGSLGRTALGTLLACEEVKDRSPVVEDSKGSLLGRDLGKEDS